MSRILDRWLPANDQLPLQRKRQALEAAVRAELKRSVYWEVRQVTCQFSRDVLTLRGHVSSFYHKQIAKTLAMHVLAGAASIHNELEVLRASGSDPWSHNRMEDEACSS